MIKPESLIAHVDTNGVMNLLNNITKIVKEEMT